MNKNRILEDLIIAQKLKAGEKLTDDELAHYVVMSKKKVNQQVSEEK